MPEAGIPVTVTSVASPPHWYTMVDIALPELTVWSALAVLVSVSVCEPAEPDSPCIATNLVVYPVKAVFNPVFTAYDISSTALLNVHFKSPPCTRPA